MISIIISTCDRYEVLAQCVRTLLEKGPYGPADELIIVDNSTRPGPDIRHELSCLCAHRLKLNYQVISNRKRNNLGYFRNYGITISAGGIIIIMDDDTFVRTGRWTEVIKEKLEKPGVMGITGVIEEPQKPSRARPEGEPVGTVTRRGQCIGHFFFRPDKDIEIDHMRGCFMAFKKEVFAETGLFDPMISGMYFEETDLCLRIRKAGGRLLLTPEIEIYHGLAPRATSVPRKEDNFMTVFYKIRNTVYVFLKHFMPDGLPVLRYALDYYREKTYFLIREKQWHSLAGMGIFPLACLAGFHNYLKFIFKGTGKCS